MLQNGFQQYPGWVHFMVQSGVCYGPLTDLLRSEFLVLRLATKNKTQPQLKSDLVNGTEKNTWATCPQVKGRCSTKTNSSFASPDLQVAPLQVLGPLGTTDLTEEFLLWPSKSAPSADGYEKKTIGDFVAHSSARPNCQSKDQKDKRSI